MANTNIKSHLAYRYGYCVNEKCDKSKRDAKGKHIIQQIASHKQFVCKDCNKVLHECPPPPVGPNWKLPAIIVGILAILGGAGFGIYKLIGQPKAWPESFTVENAEITLKVGEQESIKVGVVPEDSQKTPNFTFTVMKESEPYIEISKKGRVKALKTTPDGQPATITVKSTDNPEAEVRTCIVTVVSGGSQKTYVQSITASSKTLSMKVNDTKPLSLTVAPLPNDENIVFAVSDPAVISLTKAADNTFEVKALKAGNVTLSFTADHSGIQEVVSVTVKEKEKEKERGTKEQETVGSRKGTLKLSYGTYTGEIENGYPNGNGRLVYSRERQISHFDNKNRMAKPGESVQGTFKNGFITIGKHIDAAGNEIDRLNIGVAEGAYEEK